MMRLFLLLFVVGYFAEGRLDSWVMKEQYDEWASTVKWYSRCDMSEKRKSEIKENIDKRGMETILMTNFPNTGSTWFKDLLFGVRGVFTEAIYPEGLYKSDYDTWSDICCTDSACKKFTLGSSHTTYSLNYMSMNVTSGCRGTRMGNVTSIIKSHNPWFDRVRAFSDRGFVFLRNPIDVPIANYHFAKQGQWGKPMHDWSHDWFQFALEDYLQWHWIHAYSMKKQCVEQHFIHYEDMVLLPRSTLIKVFDFIGQNYTLEGIDRALGLFPAHQSRDDSHFFFNYFSEEDDYLVQLTYNITSIYIEKMKSNIDPPSKILSKKTIFGGFLRWWDKENSQINYDKILMQYSPRNLTYMQF